MSIIKSNELKKKQAEIEKNLRHFHGTEGYTRYSPDLFPQFLLTEGALYVGESCEAHWLFDFIASHQSHPSIADDEMLKRLQFWTLEVNGNSADIKCERDTGNIAFSMHINYTDFPLDKIRIWVAPGYFNDKIYQVAMLPSEY